jgi:hypothetical protein
MPGHRNKIRTISRRRLVEIVSVIAVQIPLYSDFTIETKVGGVHGGGVDHLAQSKLRRDDLEEKDEVFFHFDI